MFASVFVLAVSVILFAYWFRYTCLLMLSTESSRDFARPVAEANGLSFLQIIETLRSQISAAAVAELQRSLDRDYHLITYLLENAGTAADGREIERLVLRIDYHLMRLWAPISHHFSESATRAALVEQARIIAHFANAMGERNARAEHA